MRFPAYTVGLVLLGLVAGIFFRETSLRAAPSKPEANSSLRTPIIEERWPWRLTFRESDGSTHSIIRWSIDRFSWQQEVLSQPRLLQSNVSREDAATFLNVEEDSLDEPGKPFRRDNKIYSLSPQKYNSDAFTLYEATVTTNTLYVSTPLDEKPADDLEQILKNAREVWSLQTLVEIVGFACKNEEKTLTSPLLPPQRMLDLSAVLEQHLRFCRKIEARLNPNTGDDGYSADNFDLNGTPRWKTVSVKDPFQLKLKFNEGRASYAITHVGPNQFSLELMPAPATQAPILRADALLEFLKDSLDRPTQNRFVAFACVKTAVFPRAILANGTIDPQDAIDRKDLQSFCERELQTRRILLP